MSHAPPIRDISIIQTDSLKGREAPPSNGVQKHVQNPIKIETPTLSFEDKTTLKIRRPIIPKRSASVFETAVPKSIPKHDPGMYAMRFDDCTWGHTDPQTRDHYASRAEVLDVARKFDQITETVIGEDEMERANALQAATDMLLEELGNELRAECREQCELVERAKISYASVFQMLLNDSQQCRDIIDELQLKNSNLEENLTKVIDNATERVKDAQADCERQISEIKLEMEAKKEEYDNSMKRFLEQKAQLEEHVKALHRVFLDFQSDSVYITLEELKLKQESLEKKLSGKDEEIAKLNQQISRLHNSIQEQENRNSILNDANDQLRRQLQKVTARANRLQRALELQGADEQDFEEDAPEPSSTERSAAAEADGLPNQPLIDSKTVKESIEGPSFARRHGKSVAPIDTVPYITVMQKLGQIADRITDIVQQSKTKILLPHPVNDETFMTSGTPSLMIKTIQLKANEVLQLSECLEQLDFSSGESEVVISNECRFLQFIKSHNLDNPQQSNVQQKQKVSISTISTVRQIFQAKYLSDQWNRRMNRSLARFPEFVISYYIKDGENLFSALTRCTRLWKSIQYVNNPEIKLFRRFLTEKYTVDELSFFLESRHTLIGIRPIVDDEPPMINIPYEKCNDFVSTVIGSYSPILATIQEECQKHIVNDHIDYAQFLIILTKFYQGERCKRRNAARLMFQSKTSQGTSSLDFETFVSMIQSLGFQGPIESIFELFREATLLGSGRLTLQSLLNAMDAMSFHFYSIDVPLSLTKRNELTEMTRAQILQHWVRFCSWFEPFRRPMNDFDPWLKSQLMQNVKRVDTMFKANSSIQTLYIEYRQLLDFFQFALDVLVKSQDKPMSVEKSQRQLKLFENLIDLLLTHVIKQNEEEIIFTSTI